MKNEQIQFRQLPHIKQTHPNSCGAACLAMIYQWFGLQITEMEVFNEVIGMDHRAGQNCRTYSMCRDAINRGFKSTAFFAKDIRNTLRESKKNEIELIVLFHNAPQSLAAHFCVVNNVLPGSVYLRDPELETNEERRIRFRDLDNIAKSTGIRGDDICGDYTMISVSKTAVITDFLCANEKCRCFFPVIEPVAPHIERVICPYCDQVQSLNFNY